MTKAELLQALAPFADNVAVYVDTGEDQLLSIGFTRYHMQDDGPGTVRLCIGKDITAEFDAALNPSNQRSGDGEQREVHLRSEPRSGPERAQPDVSSVPALADTAPGVDAATDTGAAAPRDEGSGAHQPEAPPVTQPPASGERCEDPFCDSCGGSGVVGLGSLADPPDCPGCNGRGRIGKYGTGRKPIEQAAGKQAWASACAHLSARGVDVVEALRKAGENIEWLSKGPPQQPGSWERSPPWSRVEGAIATLRESWRSDGTEGESVHLVCNELERHHAQLAAKQAEIEQMEAMTRRWNSEVDAVEQAARERYEAAEFALQAEQEVRISNAARVAELEGTLVAFQAREYRLAALLTGEPEAKQPAPLAGRLESYVERLRGLLAEERHERIHQRDQMAEQLRTVGSERDAAREENEKLIQQILDNDAAYQKSRADVAEAALRAEKCGG